MTLEESTHQPDEVLDAAILSAVEAGYLTLEYGPDAKTYKIHTTEIGKQKAQEVAARLVLEAKRAELDERMKRAGWE